MPQTSVDLNKAIAMEGLVELSAPHFIESCVSDEANGIPFGRAVLLKDGDTREVDLPFDNSAGTTTEAEASWGVVVRDNTYPADSSGNGVVADGDGVAVMRTGVVWVQVEEAVTKGGNAFIRSTAGATLTELGRFGQDDGNEGGGALRGEKTNWEYLDSAAAGGYARVWLRY